MTDEKNTKAGAPASDPAAAVEAVSEVIPEAQDNVSSADYKTAGKTTVVTPRGWQFVPSDKGIPVVTHEGVNVTADQAAALVDESEGLVRIKKEEE